MKQILLLSVAAICLFSCKNKDDAPGCYRCYGWSQSPGNAKHYQDTQVRCGLIPQQALFYEQSIVDTVFDENDLDNWVASYYHCDKQ